jgi:heme/copper-type cytochrome/quinol oxidase subunit 4
VDVRGAADLSFEFELTRRIKQRKRQEELWLTAETQHSGGIGKDVSVYVCLLALAGIQFVIAYQDISASQMFVRMLSVAIIEGGLALLFFMHLSENRGLMWFVVIFTVAVLLGMQYGWTDSFRLWTAYPGHALV